jgi:hypothetical protein
MFVAPFRQHKGAACRNLDGPRGLQVSIYLPQETQANIKGANGPGIVIAENGWAFYT